MVERDERGRFVCHFDRIDRIEELPDERAKLMGKKLGTEFLDKDDDDVIMDEMRVVS